MEWKDKIEGLKHYSQVHRMQGDERKKYEYRVLFAALTFYVLCTAAVAGTKFKLPAEPSMGAIVWMLFILLATLTTLFLKDVQIAQAKNKLLAQWAEDSIADLVEGQTIINPAPARDELDNLKNDPKAWNNWAWHAHFTALFVFATTAALLVSTKLIGFSAPLTLLGAIGTAIAVLWLIITSRGSTQAKTIKQ